MRNSELFYIQSRGLKFKDFSASVTKREQTEGKVDLEKSHIGNTNNVSMLWLTLEQKWSKRKWKQQERRIMKRERGQMRTKTYRNRR